MALLVAATSGACGGGNDVVADASSLVADGGTDAATVDSPGADVAPPTLRELEQKVFAFCAFSSCHGSERPQRNLGLVAPVYQAIVGKASDEVPEKLRVKPFDPDNSYLLEKLEQNQPTVGERMPKDQPLDADKILMVRRWIAAGAKDD